jgi:hypothetical protein
MERTRTNNVVEEKSTWKHTGGGILRLKDSRVIKSGDVFLAFPCEVPQAFRDTVKLLSSPPTEPGPEPVKSAFTAKKRVGSSWYDVVDSNDKIISEKALKRADALALVKKLEG